MFVIFGMGKHSKDLGPGEYRTCQRCGNHTRWHRVELSNRLSLFFIPVLTLGKSRWEQCTICGHGYEI